MLRQLLESRPARHRTRSAAVVSLVVHVALAGSAVAATATTVLPEPEPEPIKDIVYIPTPVRRPEPRPAAPSRPAAPQAPTTVPRLEVPIDVPTTLPPIDPNAAPTVEPDYGSFVPSGPFGTGGAPGAAEPAPGTGNAYWLEDVERPAAPVGRQREPRYPEALRSARVEGGVTVAFVVDTLGRVEPTSIRVLESAHPLFEPAVQAALLQTRFRPARIRSGPVRQLVQQRFVFALTR